MTDKKRSDAVKLGYSRKPELVINAGNRMREYWSSLTLEERDKMREKIREGIKKQKEENSNPPKEVKLCLIEDCLKPASRKGLCQMHAWRLKHYGDVNHTHLPRICFIDGCDSKVKAHGMCETHWRRTKKGIPLNYKRPTLAAKRYRHKTIHSHPLADKRGHVYLHRVVLFDSIEWMVVPCFWCGAKLSFSLKNIYVDHLNHDRHDCSLSNLVPSCNSCNAGRTRTNSKVRTSIYTNYENDGTTGPKVGT